MKVTRSCKWCKKEFVVEASQLPRGRGVFCSRSCVARHTTSIRRPQLKENNPNWKGGVRKIPGWTTKRNYEYRHKFPEKEKAHKKLQTAVRKGLILKMPCLICGNEKSEGHHPDYTKPLEVIWLCRKHHYQAHHPAPAINISI